MEFTSTINPRRMQSVLPGAITALIIAFAATFVAEHYGGPQFLYALLFGMAFNFLATEAKTHAGIEFASRWILRFGVALLGARITAEQITALGAGPVLLVAGGVIATIAFGSWLARALGRPLSEGVLASGAVAICGASAALAISAVLPRNEHSHRFTLLTVVGVTALSTLAMIVYPMLAHLLRLDGSAAGIFLGGTIHDVAQVVGAGYMISPQAAATATFVKLFRVALLVPVVLCISLLFRGEHPHASKAPLLPFFLIGFIALVVVNSLGWIPQAVGSSLGIVSRWCLVVAIAALGVKTSFAQLRELGWRPIALLVSNTVFLALLVIAGLFLMR